MIAATTTTTKRNHVKFDSTFKLILFSKIEASGITLKDLTNTTNRKVMKRVNELMDPILIDQFVRVYGKNGKMDNKQLCCIRNEVRIWAKEQTLNATKLNHVTLGTTRKVKRNNSRFHVQNFSSPARKWACSCTENIVTLVVVVSASINRHGYSINWSKI